MAGAGTPYPSHPSGERPCCFCARSPHVRELVRLALLEIGTDDLEAAFAKAAENFVLRVWYDGSAAARVPMDCYQPLDMLDQSRRWADAAAKRHIAELEEVRDALGAATRAKDEAERVADDLRKAVADKERG